MVLTVEPHLVPSPKKRSSWEAPESRREGGFEDPHP
jgi:hypothetical protein